MATNRSQARLGLVNQAPPLPAANSFAGARNWYERSRPWIWTVVGALWTIGILGVEASSFWQYVAAVLSGAAIAVRSRQPAWALGIIWVLAVTIMLPPGVVLFLPTLAILVTLTGVTRYGGRVTRILAAISVPAGALVAGTYFGLTSSRSLLGMSIEDQTFASATFMAAVSFVTLGAAWLLGQLGYARDHYRRRQMEGVLAGQRAVEERQRADLARDMHDVMAHSLSVIVTLSDGTRLAHPELPRPVSDSFIDISRVGRDALSEVRGLLARLRSPSENQADANLTVEGVLSDTQKTGISVVLRSNGIPADASNSNYRTIVLVLREALTNALRHGDPTEEVFVYLDWARPRVEIRNRMTQMAHTPKGPGFGLIGMRERLTLVGGSLSAGPDGADWVLRAEIGAEK